MKLNKPGTHTGKASSVPLIKNAEPKQFSATDSVLYGLIIKQETKRHSDPQQLFAGTCKSFGYRFMLPSRIYHLISTPTVALKIVKFRTNSLSIIPRSSFTEVHSIDTLFITSQRTWWLGYGTTESRVVPQHRIRFTWAGLYSSHREN